MPTPPPKARLLRSRPVADVFSIAGKAIPLGDIESLASTVPTIIVGAIGGKSATEIITSIEPTLLAVIEDIANLIYPGAGTAIEVIDWVISKIRPMTQDELNTWMDRFGIENQS